MIYFVTTRKTVFSSFRVIADSKDEAINLAMENEDQDYCKFIGMTESDIEINPNDVMEVIE